MPTQTTDPKIQLIRKRMSDTINLSVEKAAAHLSNPGQYPLPADKNSLEFAIVDLFSILPKKKKEKFLEKMKGALALTPSARQQKYGDLSAVDLHSNKVVARQAEAVPVPVQMKITESDMERLQNPLVRKKVKPVTKKPVKLIQPRQAVAGAALQFAVESITCTETNDIRKDEISISAFVLSSSGELQESNNFFSGKFKKGDSKSLGAAGSLFSFNISDSVGTVFPASFAASVFLTEKDLFANKEVSEKVGAILRVTGKIIAAGSLITLFFPAVGLPLSFTILGVGTLIMLVGDGLLFFASDEISEIAADELLLETPPFAGETFAREITIGFIDGGFILGGNYKLAVRWTVV